MVGRSHATGRYVARGMVQNPQHDRNPLAWRRIILRAGRTMQARLGGAVRHGMWHDGGGMLAGGC